MPGLSGLLSGGKIKAEEMMEVSYDKKTEQEKEEIYAMYQEIFEDPEPFADYYFQMIYPKNQVLEIKNEEELAAMLHLNPYTLVWGKKEFAASYIVAVATRACYRRQGKMAELLQRAFSDLSASGQLFTYLIPANEAYYTPFDFSFVMDWETAEISLDEPMFSVCEGDQNQGEYQICKVTPSIYEETAEYLNKRRNERAGIWVKADAEYICCQDREMQSENGGLYLIQKDGEKKGFFACTIEEESLCITNLWLPEGIETAQWTSLLFREFGKRKLEICFPGAGCETGGLETKCVPKIMVRILRLTDLLEQMRATREVKLTFLVKDAFLPENHGVFCWEIGPEKSRVKRSNELPQWQVEIKTLTKLLFGYGTTEGETGFTPEAEAFFACVKPAGPISITEQV
jgi:predicted acetyltransferase